MLKILGGRHRSRPLALPKTGLRPSTGVLREALFNILNGVEGCYFLDLFAGSGAVGLEALSRGASEVVFVEKERKGAEVIKKNLFKLDERSIVHTMEATRYLETYKGKPFDMIFADPPYHKGWIERLLPVISKRSLLREEGLLFIEEGMETKAKMTEGLAFVGVRRYGNSLLHQWKKK